MNFDSLIPSNFVSVGVDLAPAFSGICLLKDDKNYETFLIDNRKKTPVHLIISFEEIMAKVVGENKVFCLEAGVFGTGRVWDLGFLNGIMRYHIALKYNSPIFLLSPTTLKKYITGNGRAKKNLMLLEVFKKYQISFKNDHEADAFALSRILYDFKIFLNQGIEKGKYPKYQLEILKKIKEGKLGKWEKWF